MNRFHTRLCSSPEWNDYLVGSLLPGALDGIALGPRVLELGPGYGAATRALARRGTELTALEYDQELATRLRAELGGSQVRVITGDAANMPFEAGEFTAVVCFTMLHHLASAAAQDRLLAEAARVLVPGGVLAGTDSRSSPRFRLLHLGDTCTPVDPRTFHGRLASAGFTGVKVHPDKRAIRFAGYTLTTEGDPGND